MSLFNNLMSKIFGHGGSTASVGGGTSTSTAAPSSTQQTSSQPTQPAPAAAASQTAGASQTATATTPPPQAVDVGAVLDGLAAKNPEKLDWKRSIVDLMKLVGMDSSLSARKQLASELHYSGDTNDSTSMNIWLHKEVLKKLAANGGKVPQELLK